MDRTKSYQELLIWQKGIEIAHDIYSICKKLPKDEHFGICSQMQRAAVSISSNIAEGYGRNGKKELIQFLHISFGSLNELETQLIIVNKVYGMPVYKITEKIIEEKKMLQGYLKKLKV